MPIIYLVIDYCCQFCLRMLFKCWYLKYFITAPSLYVPIFILPHKNSFSSLTFSTLCTWLAADMTLNLFCYTHCLQFASDLKLVWGSMICSVQSLHTGNTYIVRLCILLYTYFLYFPEKSIVLWWFCKSTQSAGCFQSMLINPITNSNFRKKFCTLYFGNLK